MKKQDVQIGHVYSTNVSGRRVNVKVLSAVDGTGYRSGRTRFRVQRVDNGQTLPKPRDPLGLHPKIEDKKRRSVVAPALVAAACAQKDPAECEDGGESP